MNNDQKAVSIGSQKPCNAHIWAVVTISAKGFRLQSKLNDDKKALQQLSRGLTSLICDIEHRVKTLPVFAAVAILSLSFSPSDTFAETSIHAIERPIQIHLNNQLKRAKSTQSVMIKINANGHEIKPSMITVAVNKAYPGGTPNLTLQADGSYRLRLTSGGIFVRHTISINH